VGIGRGHLILPLDITELLNDRGGARFEYDAGGESLALANEGIKEGRRLSSYRGRKVRRGYWRILAWAYVATKVATHGRFGDPMAGRAVFLRQSFKTRVRLDPVAVKLLQSVVKSETCWKFEQRNHPRSWFVTA